MKQRQLGKNGPMVGAIGLGAMSFSEFLGPVTDAQSLATLERAEALGVTHIDTANVYGMGKSETIIGEYLKGRDNPFTIATKSAIRRMPDGTRSFCNEPDYVRAELEGSLKRLGQDHVDLYYMHRRDPSMEIEAVMEMMLGLKEEGLIRGIGFSEVAPGTIRRAAAIGPVAAVQNEYSLWTRLPELGVIQACEEVGAAFVPFSPVARGMLGENPVSRAQLDNEPFRGSMPRFQPGDYERNCAKLAEFAEYATSIGTVAPTLAIAWVLDKGEHLIPIPGTKNVEHLEQLVAAASFTMTDAIRGEIDRILPPGWAHGDRYTTEQWIGIERYC